MSKSRVMEGTVLPIIEYVKANIDTALADLRADRPDNKVSLSAFKDYFIFTNAISYRTPALFVLGRNVDFRLANGANHINARVDVQLNAVFQDRTGDFLTYQAWRYHDVLHALLNRTELESTDGKVKNIIKVVSSQFGDTVQIKEQTESPFRTEVMILLEVDHYEFEN